MHLSSYLQVERKMSKASEADIAKQKASDLLKKLQSIPNLEGCIKISAFEGNMVTADPMIKDGIIRIPEFSLGCGKCGGVYQQLEELYHSTEKSVIDDALTRFCGPDLDVTLDSRGFDWPLSFVDLEVHLH